MPKKIVVALGGNAILRHREKGTAEEQLGHVRATCTHLAKMVEAGHQLVIAHGNGPQVGDILLKNEISKDKLPPMPLDICGAQSQGMIGYMLQRSLDQELRSLGVERPVLTVLTQVVVDPKDSAFEDPTKFIGPFYTAMEAKQLEETKQWTVKEDGQRGYRRVVPSPEPSQILELSSIGALCAADAIVIAGGGGGIPITETSKGELVGVEAVIDKDHTAALMAERLGFDVLLILTDVDAAALDFGKPSERALGQVSIPDARRYLAEGEFARGSMGPKVESCIRFVERSRGTAIITSLERAEEALGGTAGTRFV